MNTKKREATKTFFEQVSAKESDLLIVALLKGEQAISRGETVSTIEAKRKWINV